MLTRGPNVGMFTRPVWLLATGSNLAIDDGDKLSVIVRNDDQTDPLPPRPRRCGWLDGISLDADFLPIHSSVQPPSWRLLRLPEPSLKSSPGFPAKPTFPQPIPTCASSQRQNAPASMQSPPGSFQQMKQDRERAKLA